jgi:hypothetical protein
VLFAEKTEDGGTSNEVRAPMGDEEMNQGDEGIAVKNHQRVTRISWSLPRIGVTNIHPSLAMQPQ